MRNPLHAKVERGRLISGKMRSTKENGCNGAFLLRKKRRNFFVIAANGLGWEHVSVSIQFEKAKIPTWEEMCWIKDLFWDEDECVIQYHPAASDYVNNHPAVLHLWKPIDQAFPKPPAILVGIKELGTLK